jgi:hypothetical protein
MDNFYRGACVSPQDGAYTGAPLRFVGIFLTATRYEVSTGSGLIHVSAQEFLSLSETPKIDNLVGNFPGKSTLM